MTDHTRTAIAPDAHHAVDLTALEHAPEHGRGALEQAATVVMLPVTVAQRLLPDNPVPVALGAAALATAGVIEWPVAAAVGLGYLALRRWTPLGLESPHSSDPSRDRSDPTGV